VSNEHISIVRNPVVCSGVYPRPATRGLAHAVCRQAVDLGLPHRVHSGCGLSARRARWQLAGPTEGSPSSTPPATVPSAGASGSATSGARPARRSTPRRRPTASPSCSTLSARPAHSRSCTRPSRTPESPTWTSSPPTTSSTRPGTLPIQPRIHTTFGEATRRGCWRPVSRSMWCRPGSATRRSKAPSTRTGTSYPTRTGRRSGRVRCVRRYLDDARRRATSQQLSKLPSRVGIDLSSRVATHSAPAQLEEAGALSRAVAS
jgi:hypothetical protein